MTAPAFDLTGLALEPTAGTTLESMQTLRTRERLGLAKREEIAVELMVEGEDERPERLLCASYAVFPHYPDLAGAKFQRWYEVAALNFKLRGGTFAFFAPAFVRRVWMRVRVDGSADQILPALVACRACRGNGLVSASTGAVESCKRCQTGERK